MIFLLAGGFLEHRLRRRRTRREFLRLIQRLRADLADVVHAHQPGGMRTLRRRQLGGRRLCRRGHRPAHPANAGQRSQAAIEFADQFIKHHPVLLAAGAAASGKGTSPLRNRLDYSAEIAVNP
ncbi:hypothetical protein ACOIY0_22365 [Burkholderia contaminans]|uniref:hypothetical protein n=1 Tax=Burkholderia contaminans TaxID=488447 RepID=UPI003B97F64D